MFRIPSALLFSLLFLSSLHGEEPSKESAEKITFAETDWPWWRGPNRNGIGSAKEKPPLKWSETENILWKTPVPGRGHGSPTVVGEQVFLATADHAKEIQSVLSFDRKSGKQLWQTEVHRVKDGFEKKGNPKKSLASSSVACDGQRVFINFLNNGAIYTTALSLDGKQLWQSKITDYVLHQGFGSSPAIYRSLVIVSADNKGTGVIAALDRVSGKEVWKIERPKLPNYASPIILKIGDRDQLLLTGCDLVTSLDPLTGKKLWEAKGSTTECVTSPVTDGQHIFISGGYPKKFVAALLADGSAKVVWEKPIEVYVPSMIVDRGYLYAMQDNEFAMCWKCDTGKEMWKVRLKGTFTASLVMVGEHLFATNESGQTFIFKATPENFELVQQNQLGNDVYATPTICGNCIFMRVANSDKADRNETLYCIGNKE